MAKRIKSFLGNQLKELRLDRGLTQSELAEKLKYPGPAFISMIENGKSKLPLYMCKKIVKKLKLSAEEVKLFKRALLKEYYEEVKRYF